MRSRFMPMIAIAVASYFSVQCRSNEFETKDHRNGASKRDNSGTTDPVGTQDGKSQQPPATPPATPPASAGTPVRIAFTGDQKTGANPEAVLNMIKAEKAEMLVVAGDFDYSDDPEKWDAMLTKVLGDTFPVVAAPGNHDTGEWEKGYKVKLTARQAKTPQVKCSGEVGTKQSCEFKGVTLILSGVGVIGSGHEEYLDTALQTAKTPWKFCVWHKNQTSMQLGDKSDEVGWPAYQTCLKHGAIVATGHEHSYGRTYLMSDFEKKVLVNKDSNLVVEPGKSFAFVSGLGGNSIRDQKQEGEWWASKYTKQQNGNYGALICDFNIDGNARKGKCFFKDIAGKLVDQFTMESKL